MKRKIFFSLIVLLSVQILSCTDTGQKQGSTESTLQDSKGQSAVVDDASQKNVVQVAVASKDHTTLVTAIKAASLVDALSNAGPFTVFAPTNEAFALLPSGTVDGLLKPEKNETLTDILQYHVSVGVFKTEAMTDGQTIGQVNGDNITISKKDGKIIINGNASIVATVPASNGIVYVIDKVLLPPVKK